MLAESLKLNVKDKMAILNFEGEITFDNSNQFKEEVKKRLSEEEEVKNLIINLSQVSYLDSSGVGVVLSLFKFMRNRAGKLVTAAANEKIKRVFEVTKIEEIIPVYEDVEAAAANLIKIKN